MRTILIVSELFSPINAVGGMRASYFARYLQDNGWNVTVITVKNYPPYAHDNKIIDENDLKILRVPGQNARITPFNKIIFQLQKITTPEIVGSRKLYKSFGKAAEAILVKDKIGVIWGSSGPEWVHLLCSKLSAKYKIPWVADFRDLPDPFCSLSPINNYWMHLIKKRRKRYLKKTSYIICVSRGLAEDLNCYPNKNEIILNGYDEALHYFVKCSAGSWFQILYCGSIYRGRRDPRNLLTAFERLLKSNRIRKTEARVQFVGVGDQLDELVSSMELGENVKIIKERVSYAQSIKLMYESTVLLHLSHKNERGIMTTKIFDYLATGHPILSVPGDNDCVDDLLRRTGHGVSLEKPEEIADQIEIWYKKWLKNSSWHSNLNKHNISQYSRKSQTEKLAMLLEKIVDA